MTDLLGEYIAICREISMRLNPDGCNAACDMCWSHVMQAAYGSGSVVEADTYTFNNRKASLLFQKKCSRSGSTCLQRHTVVNGGI